MIFSLILLIHSVTASFQGGAVMPDGKVDKVISPTGKATGGWHAPVWGVDVGVDLAPNWRALQYWNDARVAFKKMKIMASGPITLLQIYGGK